MTWHKVMCGAIITACVSSLAVIPLIIRNGRDKGRG
jgi:hypothetical protein